MHEVPLLMEEFAAVIETPFQISTRLKEVAWNFVCRLYSNDTDDDSDVDLVRMKVFSQKSRDMERIPPMSDALDQHFKRSVFQASIWTAAHRSIMPVNNPTDHGWKEEDSRLVPIWRSLPLASDVFQLDVRCTCKSTCSMCNCRRAKLRCTCMCKFPCAFNNPKFVIMS